MQDQITATQFYVMREAMNCSLDLMYLAPLLTREHVVMQAFGTKDIEMDLRYMISEQSTCSTEQVSSYHIYFDFYFRAVSISVIGSTGDPESSR